jgi:L-ascorbate metabolism protein UlaG (beta-lactamase superfamily)
MTRTKLAFQHNPALSTLPVEGWHGNPTDEHGRFFHPDYPFIPGMKDHIRWALTPNKKRREKKQDTWHVSVNADRQFLKKKEQDVLIWLGHASFFLRMAGVSMLIDPMFGGFPGIPRRSETPFLAEDFEDIDMVLVSHNHRDHCDKASICDIARYFPRIKILTGLGTDVLLQKWVKSAEVQGAGWYQQYETGVSGLEIFYLPARHWSRRWIFDTNRHLWGAFLIRTAQHTLYFSGDTGYGRHFADTAALFPNIDTAIIGIGTYQPSFESPMHINPEDAVRGFQDLQAKTMIPMHYGTFDLSHEPHGEPLRRLLACAPQGLKVPDVGENYLLPATSVSASQQARHQFVF